MTTLATTTGTPLVGEVTGRVELQPDGSLTVHLQPLQQPRVRHVVTQPVHRHYRGCDCRLAGNLRYVGPLTPRDRRRLVRLEARWVDPPWWSLLRWNRQRRTELKQEREKVTA